MTTQKDLINSIASSLRDIVNSTDRIDSLYQIDGFVAAHRDKAISIAKDTGFRRGKPVDEFLDALEALGFFDDDDN